mgnify:CR=1 FL=1
MIKNKKHLLILGGTSDIGIELAKYFIQKNWQVTIHGHSNLNKIKKIYKNRFFWVNYIDTFSPLIGKIKKSLKKRDINQINLNYSKINKYYKYKNEFALEWLDHPLSLILFFFKKFPKMNIKKCIIRKKK